MNQHTRGMDGRIVRVNMDEPGSKVEHIASSILTDGEKMIWAASYAWNVAEFGSDCAQAAHDAVVQARKDLASTSGDPLDMLRAMVGR